MHRTDDRDANVEEGRYIAAHIPGARFVEFPGGDHSWWTQGRDAILDEIEELVTGVRPAARAGPRARDCALHRHRRVDRAPRPARATRSGRSCWRATTQRCGASSSAPAAARSRPPGTAFSRRSTGRRGRSAARSRSATPCVASGSRSEPDFTPASASWSVRTSPGSPSTSARDMRGLPGRARSSSRRPSRPRRRLGDRVRGSRRPRAQGRRCAQDLRRRRPLSIPGP